MGNIHFGHFVKNGRGETLCGRWSGSYSNFKKKVTCKLCLKLIAKGKTAKVARCKY